MQKRDEHQAKPKPNCDVAMCAGEMVADIKKPTGFVRLCYEHYIDHHNQEAREWNRAQGIFSKDDAIAYLRRFHTAKGHTGLHRLIERDREPGEDDE